MAGYFYNWKNLFFEMKGDVGMSKATRRCLPKDRKSFNPIPISLFLYSLQQIAYIMNFAHYIGMGFNDLGWASSCSLSHEVISLHPPSLQSNYFPLVEISGCPHSSLPLTKIFKTYSPLFTNRIACSCYPIKKSTKVQTPAHTAHCIPARIRIRMRGNCPCLS